jgi:hypothetical protein
MPTRGLVFHPMHQPTMSPWFFPCGSMHDTATAFFNRGAPVSSCTSRSHRDRHLAGALAASGVKAGGGRAGLATS